MKSARSWARNLVHGFGWETISVAKNNQLNNQSVALATRQRKQCSRFRACLMHRRTKGIYVRPRDDLPMAFWVLRARLWLSDWTAGIPNKDYEEQCSDRSFGPRATA